MNLHNVGWLRCWKQLNHCFWIQGIVMHLIWRFHARILPSMAMISCPIRYPYSLHRRCVWISHYLLIMNFSMDISLIHQFIRYTCEENWSVAFKFRSRFSFSSFGKFSFYLFILVIFSVEFGKKKKFVCGNLIYHPNFQQHCRRWWTCPTVYSLCGISLVEVSAQKLKRSECSALFGNAWLTCLLLAVIVFIILSSCLCSSIAFYKGQTLPLTGHYSSISYRCNLESKPATSDRPIQRISKQTHLCTHIFITLIRNLSGKIFFCESSSFNKPWGVSKVFEIIKTIFD